MKKLSCPKCGDNCTVIMFCEFFNNRYTNMSIVNGELVRQTTHVCDGGRTQWYRCLNCKHEEDTKEAFLQDVVE